MQVKLGLEDVKIGLGNKGLVLKIADNAGKHVGTLQIGQATAVWMKGRKRPQNGKRIRMDRLVEILDAE